VKNKISCFIIAKNEEKLIAKAILSVINIVDEVIVIDSGSVDDTVKISRDLGAKVVFNQWQGYVQQKIFGQKLCRNDWILNIDADEELSHDLQSEISYIFGSQLQDKFKAYKLNIVIMMPQDNAPRLWAPSNCPIRLYNKQYVSFDNTLQQSTTHDSAVLKNLPEDGNVLTLLSPVLHFSSVSIWQLVNKINFYTTEQAKDFVDNSRVVSRFRIVVEFFWWFLKAYFLRRYFVFGFQGFIYSVIFAFGKFLRLAKVYESQRQIRYFPD
jgi:glycosyltransferase involved in cell wall biosynthesis